VLRAVGEDSHRICGCILDGDVVIEDLSQCMKSLIMS
jgi:hypothetical protein